MILNKIKLKSALWEIYCITDILPKYSKNNFYFPMYNEKEGKKNIYIISDSQKYRITATLH